MAALRDNIVSVIGRIRLGQEMELISNLGLMVSMDSSGLHMSSLVGLPVVSVWGRPIRSRDFTVSARARRWPFKSICRAGPVRCMATNPACSEITGVCVRLRPG